MYTAKLSLKKDLQIQRWERPLDSAELLGYLLSSFVQNGQIADGSHTYFDDNGYLSTIVNIFHHDALQTRYFNKYLDDWFGYFADDDVVITPLGEAVESDPITTPEQASAFVLTTQVYELESPVKGLDSHLPVPIHYLPKTYHDDTFYNLLSWMRDYHACDGLQMRCTVGELWALEQMGNITSELTQQGREICQILSEKLQKPVYYHLYHYYISEDPATANCPSCGGDWRLATPLHGRYDFKCDKCLLLSNIGLSELENNPATL